MVRWAPQVSLASLQSLIRPQDHAQSSRAATADEAASKAVTVGQNVPQEARAKGVSTATDMAEWLQTAARNLANMEQAIQQLKVSQEQIVRDNAELAERLKATEEQVARENAAVAERLTATEAQIARDNALVEQLKVAQSEMAHDNAALSSELKVGLEQMTRAIAKASEKPSERASEQNRRPKPSRQIVTSTIRPAVRAPQVRAPQATTKPTNPPRLVNLSTAPR
jgi:chromosome segregation ATPase